MDKVLFKDAKYLFSTLSSQEIPHVANARGIPLPEIAVAGKSNVGKSSLINHLLTNRQLAKTSSKPGKTISLNFFSIDDRLSLVDLPGYGYAATSKELKSQWPEAIEKYLLKRDDLKLILVLLDLRHLPTKQDLSFIEWLTYFKKPLLIIFTKADKLSGNLQKKGLEKNLEAIRLHTKFQPKEYLLYSIKEGRCREVLINIINQHL